MATIERRAFMKGATLGALAFTVGGSTVMLTARQARAGNVPFRMLKENEAETIESMGETLVPGAPTFYSSYATTMDMNSGALNNNWGPEDLTFEAVGGQMSRRGSGRTLAAGMDRACAQAPRRQSDAGETFKNRAWLGR
jgi:hypothetical protein